MLTQLVIILCSNDDCARLDDDNALGTAPVTDAGNYYAYEIAAPETAGPGTTPCAAEAAGNSFNPGNYASSTDAGNDAGMVVWNCQYCNNSDLEIIMIIPVITMLMVMTVSE